MIVFMLLALVGFVASAVVHAESWGPHPLSINQTWPLHVGIFVTFIPAVLGAKLTRRRHRSLAELNQLRRQPPQYVYAPPWMKRVLSVCGAYALVNFVVFFVMLAAGPARNVHEREGRYVFRVNRNVERDATAEEIRSYRATGARGFSGHWMFFYWASLVGLVDNRRRRAAEGEEEALRARLRAGKPLPPRQSTRAPPRLGLWGHTVMMFLGTLVLLFGFPLAESYYFIRLQERYYPRIKVFGAIAFVLFIPSALLGAQVALRLLRKIPARCPECGGRMYYEGKWLANSNQPRPYHCADCGVLIDQSET
jgi:hypothetical protein